MSRLIDADEFLEKMVFVCGTTKVAVMDLIDELPTIEPNLVINPDEVKRGDVTMIGTEIVVMHHDDYMEMMLKSAAIDDGSWERFAAEPCEDAVSRESAIKEIKGWFQIIELNPDILIDNIKSLPYVAPSRPKGEWIDVNDQYQLATCSNCEKITMFERWGHSVREYDFCPNCGADMRGADDE